MCLSLGKLIQENIITTKTVNLKMKEDKDIPPGEGLVGLSVGSIPDSAETEKLEG